MAFDLRGGLPSPWAAICSVSVKRLSGLSGNWVLCRPGCSDRVHAPITGNSAIQAMA